MIELMNTLITKTGELKEELQHTGLWQKETPAWVMEYRSDIDTIRTNFAQWLQFVFIPNHLQKNKPVPLAEKRFIVPQAILHFSDDVKKGKLLQILIEIDALL